MPLDATGYRRTLTPAEAADLASLKAGRWRIRTPLRWQKLGEDRPLALWWVMKRLVVTGDPLGYCASTALEDGQGYWRLQRQVPSSLCLESYNDLPTTTHADILALYDRAIAELEAP